MNIIKELDYKPNILASALASKKSAVFAALLPQPPSPDGYWNKPLKGMQRRIAELSQFGIQLKTFSYNQADPFTFQSEASKIIKLQPDAVILAPFFKKESLALIEVLNENRIPFVFIDSEIKNAGQISYIGQNSYQSGLVSGKLLDMLMYDGNILIIHFAKEMDNQNHLVQREKGFYQWFKKRTNSPHQLFTTEITNSDSNNWMKDTFKLISENNIKGIFVTNSKVFFVGRLIEQYNLKGLKVIGHDLIKENAIYLKKDIVQFLICQQPEEQGFNAIDVLFRHVVQKRKTEQENYTSIDIVTRENMDYYKEF